MTPGDVRGDPRFRVLGVVAVAASAEFAGAPRLRRLLAALLVHAGDVVSVDRIADIVWGDEPPARISNAVQTLVSRLRALLRDAGVGTGDGNAALLTRSPGYVLTLDADDLDARRFERIVMTARTTPADQAIALLDDALALWRGPAYAEFTDAPFARAEAARLEELRAIARGLHAEALLTTGRHDEAVSHLEALTSDHPLSERPHAQLMLALHRCGRTPDALTVFRRLHRRLAEDLALEPGPELQELHTRLLRRDAGLAIASVTPFSAGVSATPASGTAPARTTASVRGTGEPDHRAPRTADGTPAAPTGNLPPATPKAVIGRDAALDTVRHKVGATRLVTLTGTGGVGKTTLALAVARDLAGDYRDGVWVFELASIGSARDVAGFVTTTLDIPQQQTMSAIDRLTATLRTMHVLMVFDNCEHVIEGVATTVDAVLRLCPDVTVLATSREPLGIAGEQIWPVPPLALIPGGDDDAHTSPAVRLFAERAAAVAATFAITDDNAADVRELCRRLDGLPLAIELAAMRMPAMTPAEVVERLPMRLRFLRSTGRLTEARHQTLRAVVDWSYDVLDPLEQRCFETVAVFSGSFTAAAAEQVAARAGLDATQTLDMLGRLVDKSLVIARPQARATRYTLLETLRDYGLHRLAERGELERTQAAHAAHWLAFAEQMAARLFTREQNDVVDAITEEMTELRSAHTWALGHDLGLALRYLQALTGYAELRLSPELFTWALRTLTVAEERGVETPDVATAHALVAAGARLRGDLVAARRHGERVLQWPAEEAAFAHHHALVSLADVSVFEGRLADVHALDRRRRALPDAPADDVWVAVQAMQADAIAYAYAGDVAAALALADAIRDALGADDAPGLAAYAPYVAGEALLEHDPVRAHALMREALEAAQQGSDRLLLGVVMVSAASLRLRLDEPHQAVRLFRDVVTYWRRLGLHTMLWTTLRSVVALLSSLDATTDAAVLFGIVTTRETAAPIYGADQVRLEVIEQVLRARLGHARFRRARTEGAAMSDDEAMRFVASALAAVDA